MLNKQWDGNDGEYRHDASGERERSRLRGVGNWLAVLIVVACLGWLVTKALGRNRETMLRMKDVYNVDDEGQPLKRE